MDFIFSLFIGNVNSQMLAESLRRFKVLPNIYFKLKFVLVCLSRYYPTAFFRWKFFQGNFIFIRIMFIAVMYVVHTVTHNVY